MTAPVPPGAVTAALIAQAAEREIARLRAALLEAGAEMDRRHEMGERAERDAIIRYLEASADSSEWAAYSPGYVLRRLASRLETFGGVPGSSAGLTGAQDAEGAFLAASVAVWREIDRLEAEPDGYHPTRMSMDLRKAERAAWERYRDLMGGDQP